MILTGAGWDQRFLGNSGRKGPQQVLAATQPPAEGRISPFAICSLAASPEEQIVSQQRQPGLGSGLTPWRSRFLLQAVSAAATLR